MPHENSGVCRLRHEVDQGVGGERQGRPSSSSKKRSEFASPGGRRRVPGRRGVGWCFQHVRNMLFMGFPATFMAELEPQSTLHCSECRSSADSWHNTCRGGKGGGLLLKVTLRLLYRY